MTGGPTGAGETMGKITGFMEFDRHDRHYRPVDERVKHWQEFVEPLPRRR